ncbi:stage II sporulation protein SB [Bacillus cereus]|uniref:stage II sporulation protein SB n=1 Tax=Bacillus cereus TaxID=1396 RepID=UPI001F2A7084|nr:stage II sporulation protein SB [Bacillus cereus]BCD11484.1 stage II sporulation protein SB [Bacillus cereus]
MAEVNIQKSLFFKEKKEEPNTDFSLVKGALTENINRLEKLMNNSSSKYIRVKKKRKCIVHFLLFFIS